MDLRQCKWERCTLGRKCHFCNGKIERGVTFIMEDLGYNRRSYRQYFNICIACFKKRLADDEKDISDAKTKVVEVEEWNKTLLTLPEKERMAKVKLTEALEKL